MSAKFQKCKMCGNEIASTAKQCPHCGAKNSKPIYKKWWFWAVITIICFVGIGMNDTNSQSDQQQKIQSTENDTIQESDDKSKEQAEEKTEKNKKVVTKENYDKINNGMTEEEVEAILGKPKSKSENEIQGIGKTVLKHYQEGFSLTAIDVYFTNGKVTAKNWTEL